MPVGQTFRYLIWIGTIGLHMARLFFIGEAVSQTVPSLDVPASTQNTRFFSDLYVVKRPSLTFNGFSCAQGEDCNHGLGVAEVLELLSDPSADKRTMSYAQGIVASALLEIDDSPATRQDVFENSRRLQSRGLLAILALVAEANNRTIAGSALPAIVSMTAAEALESFFDAARQRDAYRIHRSFTDDAVKWIVPLTNLARSADLLLAIENAYAFYPSDRFDAPLPALPTCEEKAAFLSFIAQESDELDDLGNLPVFFGIKRDEIQPGNWPMKVHVGVAYAALTQQASTLDSCIQLPNASFQHWLERGMRSAGSPTVQNRSKHWNYQTDSGQRFFAEGPYYFHLTLSEVIPFWHAVRINRLLNFHPDFILEDPFHSSWFTDPLAWLADTVGPVGDLLPLDDGNRAFMRGSDLLRWAGDYGDASLGRQYAWISDQRDDSTRSDASYLGVFLAIPMVPSQNGWPPPAAVGTVPSLEGDRTEEQTVVLRRNAAASNGSSQTHFLALNGEYGDAIIRGEGHEQPDQLQLLYYIDDASILVDSGYDDVSGIENSTWNHYYDHNVLTINDGSGDGDGGLLPPVPDLFSFRISSDHASADFLGHVESGRIDVLSGQVELRIENAFRTGPTATYSRRAIFVGDETDPYLIDVNRGIAPHSAVDFRMGYHLGGKWQSNSTGEYRWLTVGSQGTRVETVVRPYRIDGSVRADIQSDEIMERFRTEEAIDRLDLTSEENTQSFTTVAFISAGPVGRVLPEVTELDVTQGAGRAGSDRVAAVWAIRQRPGTVDLFLTPTGSGPVSERVVLLDEQPVTLMLAPGASFGFNRLVRQPGSEMWQPDPEYAFQLIANARPVSREMETIHQPGQTLEIGPNPVASSARIRFSVLHSGRVTLDVYDIQGRVVDSILNATVQKGNHEIQWRSDGLANGAYLLRQLSDTIARSIPFIIQR